MTILMLRRFCEHDNDAGRGHHAATHRISAEVSLPVAQGRHADSKSTARLAPDAGRRQGEARCRAGFMSRSLRDLGNPRGIHVRILAVPFAFRRNSAMRQHVFFGRLWRKWYINAMPPG
jgi:hypothetical protein